MSSQTNSPFLDYTHPDDHTSTPFNMTPGFKPFPVLMTQLDIFRSPNSDENEIALHVVTICSNIQVTRIKEVRIKEKMS